MREFFENVLVYTGGIICLIFWLSLFVLVLIEIVTSAIDKEKES